MTVEGSICFVLVIFEEWFDCFYHFSFQIILPQLIILRIFQGMRYGVGIIEFLNGHLLADVDKPIQLAEVP